jgi:hypothetical protein
MEDVEDVLLGRATWATPTRSGRRRSGRLRGCQVGCRGVHPCEGTTQGGNGPKSALISCWWGSPVRVASSTHRGPEPVAPGGRATVRQQHRRPYRALVGALGALMAARFGRFKLAQTALIRKGFKASRFGDSECSINPIDGGGLIGTQPFWTAEGTEKESSGGGRLGVCGMLTGCCDGKRI